MGSRLEAVVKRTIRVLFIVITAGILFCTLYPFDPFPPNRVTWTKDSNGICFSQRGVAFTEKPLSLSGNALRGDSCTLELWIKPAQTDSVAVVLDFYEPGNPWRFLIHQYQSGLILTHDVASRFGRPVRSKADIDEGLRQNQLCLITIASGPTGTSVYFDAKSKRTLPGFKISLADLSGQLLIGSSAVRPESWSGEIHGLAIYPKKFEPEDVADSYRRWIEGKVTSTDNVFAKYMFTEGTGTIVHDTGSTQSDLFIPKIYRVPHHSFLRLPWYEFYPTSDYLSDVVNNVAGFIPFGFLLYLLPSTSERRHPILYTILIGAIFSLSIEVMQAFVPQRDSGTTDIITNTLGTAVGVLLARSTVVRSLFERFRADWLTRACPEEKH